MSYLNYSITQQICADDDTALYVGHRRSDQHPVTLKLLVGAVPTPWQVARLRHEYAVLQELSLPGVLQAHGVEAWEQGIALVLESFDGRPLHDVAKTRKLTPREVVAIGASIADALDAVHRRHVIHKDVKPHNILFDAATGQVKLTGFGIASRLSRELKRAASPHLLEGTLAYMSPEQTGRMNRTLDKRTDLYSLGVALYELLTSALPFQATDAVELVHSHIARTPAAPHELAPEVPQIVSDIVMKLLAKAADDRYQTAYGLKVDLEACLKQWDAEGGAPPFALGGSDRSDALRLPQKLYGRREATAAIVGAFERASEGAAELLLVSGPSGAGKSALVNELRAVVARRQGGLFLAGKFDQLSRREPYAALMQPLRELCGNLLSEPADVLEGWRTRLDHALDANGQVLIDLIPELSSILGPKPRVPELGPVESQNRLCLVFQNLVRSFAAHARPLVLFFDDLQWADPASLRLLRVLLTDPEGAHLLVIGAYRGGEVGAGHPLSSALDEIRRAGAPVSTVELGALSLPRVIEYVADALGCERARAEPLAALVREKTGGNPLFVGQFLETLHKEGLLSFDHRSASWTWELQAIGEAAINDDVASLLETRIRRLPAPTRRILELAACIGHEFDLGTLGVISELPPGEAASAIWEALREGLILSLDADYHLVHAGGDGPEPGRGATPAGPFKISYRFLHDRVQQAAYAAIAEEERQGVHLRIGRRMLATLPHQGEGALFDVVQHLNLGAALIDDPGERRELARMNLTAGRMARARAAYAAAASYFEAGLSLLSAPGGESDEATHALSFALHAEGAECAYLSGAFARAEALLDVLLDRANSNVERSRTHELRLALHLTQGRIDDALRVGRTALALLGIEVPDDERALRDAADAELAAARRELGARRTEDLLAAPEVADEEARSALRLLMALTMPAAFASPSLYTFVIARQVTLSLGRGHSDVSAYGYMAYGWIAARALGRYEEAYQLGRLALDLNDRFGNADLSCKLNYMFGAYISFFTKHLRSSLEYFSRAYEAGIRTGDFPYLSYTCVHTAIARVALGDECGAVRDEVDRSLALMQRTRDELATAVLTGARQVLTYLMGETRGRSTLDDGVFDEAAYEEKVAAPGYTTVALSYYSLRQQLFYLFGDHEGALRMTALARAKMEGGVGHHFTTELMFYACLTLLALERSDGRARDAETLATYRERIAIWAERCPENYRQKHLLLEAEAARTAGEELAAIGLYDRAIQAARSSGFVRDEALGSELCAELHVASGREVTARLYVTQAYHAYLRWGATAKVEELAERYPDLLGAAAQHGASARASTRPPQAGALDTVSVMRAAQAISSEIFLGRLLERLLRIVLESAGAQRGALLLSRDGVLMVEARITVEPDEVRVGPPVPLDSASDLARSIVRHVERTREAVVLADAAQGGEFSSDPHLAGGGVRSLLCIPMVHQGRLTGVLHLENNATPGAFGPVRVELCSLLASQAAIAVQNALLYGRVEEASHALRRSNDVLEAEVARRTEELRDANDRLTLELASRRHVEDERAALQEKIIQVQRDRLLELSAPLIPVTDRILILPLIGEIDPSRAHQVLETTLNAVAARQTEVILVDVTGARQVDGGVASTLVRAAAAVRLLGARLIVTGLRPDAARALVELGTDLQGIVTHGTLQAGLAHAQRQLRAAPGTHEQQARPLHASSRDTIAR